MRPLCVLCDKPLYKTSDIKYSINGKIHYSLLHKKCFKEVDFMCNHLEYCIDIASTDEIKQRHQADYDRWYEYKYRAHLAPKEPYSLDDLKPTVYNFDRNPDLL